MTDQDARLTELLDRLEATLQDIRRHMTETRGATSSPGTDKAVEAFADEAFRARDA